MWNSPLPRMIVLLAVATEAGGLCRMAKTTTPVRAAGYRLPPSCWMYFSDRFLGSRRAKMRAVLYNVPVSGTFCTANDPSGFFFALARHVAKLGNAGAASWFAPSRRLHSGVFLFRGASGSDRAGPMIVLLTG